MAKSSNPLNNLLDQLTGAVTKLSEPLNGVVTTMQKLATLSAGPLATGLHVYHTATTGIINTMQSFVAKANPAAAFQFNRALDDLAATMGQILQPVLDGVTDLIRVFADVLMDLKPVFDVLTETIGEALKFIAKAVSEVAELFGGKKGSSVGAAVRPASYGSIADIGKRTTLNALNQSSRKSAADETKSLHDTIKDWMRRWDVKKSDADRIGKVVFPNLDEANRKALNQWLEQRIDDR